MSLRVKCPRCGKLWTARQGTDSIECNCHLYCPHGTKPSDCTVTAVTHQGTYNWPQGIDLDYPDDREDEKAVDWYCSTHAYYFYKAPVLIEVDWTKTDERATKPLRYWGGGVTQ